MNQTVRKVRKVALSICLTIACVIGGAVTPAGAQTGAGEITGLVKDQGGAAVPGATITVTETRTNLQRVVVSTGDGVYTAASLAPGDYRLDLDSRDPNPREFSREGRGVAAMPAICGGSARPVIGGCYPCWKPRRGTRRT